MFDETRAPRPCDPWCVCTRRSPRRCTARLQSPCPRRHRGKVRKSPQLLGRAVVTPNTLLRDSATLLTGGRRSDPPVMCSVELLLVGTRPKTRPYHQERPPKPVTPRRGTLGFEAIP